MAQRGRPKKVVEETKEEVKVEEVKAEEMDIQAMIAQAVAMALKESNVQHEAEISEIKKKYSGKKDDIKIEVKNNTFGTFILTAKKGKASNIFAKLPPQGTTLITYQELREYNSVCSNFLQNGEIIISDVFSEETTIETVASALGLASLYEGEEKITDVEDILTKEYSVFIAFIESNPKIFGILLAHAYEMHKKGQFNFADKQNYFRMKDGNMELFK